MRRYLRYLTGFLVVRNTTTSARVVATFHLHKNGALSDIDLINLASVEEFATATRAAVSITRIPLPPDDPDESARFLVTFVYNEGPTPSAAPTNASDGVVSLRHATAADVERRLGRPTAMNGALWRYTTSPGDFVVVFDDTMQVWTAVPKNFDLAVVER